MEGIEALQMETLVKENKLINCITYQRPLATKNQVEQKKGNIL